MVKIGLSFLLSLILLGILPTTTAVPANNFLVFLLVCVKELFIGYVVGLIMQMFLSVLLLAGEFTDLQMGVGMASIYDPQSNIAMPIIGSVFNLFYIMLFFISNGHLTFFKVIFYSFDIVPLGAALMNPQCGQYVVLFFSNILALGLKLALPIVTMEIITEIGLGVLMRTVPQINVFVVGMQLKLLVGLVLLVLIFPALFGFFDSMTNTMFESIQKGLSLMV